MYCGLIAEGSCVKHVFYIQVLHTALYKNVLHRLFWSTPTLAVLLYPVYEYDGRYYSVSLRDDKHNNEDIKNAFLSTESELLYNYYLTCLLKRISHEYCSVISLNYWSSQERGL